MARPRQQPTTLTTPLLLQEADKTECSTSNGGASHMAGALGGACSTEEHLQQHAAFRHRGVEARAELCATGVLLRRANGGARLSDASLPGCRVGHGAEVLGECASSGGGGRPATAPAAHLKNTTPRPNTTHHSTHQAP